MLDFFIAQGAIQNLIGVCQSEGTKEKIQFQYKVPVSRDYQKSLKKYAWNIALVCICIKPEQKQEEIYLYTYTHFPQVKICIEKSYIWNDALSDIFIQNPQHLIVQNELWSSEFFKQLLKTKTSDLHRIQMILSPCHQVYQNIHDEKVYFFSYIFEYIGFLKWDHIEITQKYMKNDKYFIILHIDTIEVTLVFQDGWGGYSQDSVIYEYKNKEKYVFHRSAPYARIGTKKIQNIPGETSYFHYFLKEKIPQLLEWKTQLRTQIDLLKKFRKYNQFQDQISSLF